LGPAPEPSPIPRNASTYSTSHIYFHCYEIYILTQLALKYLANSPQTESLFNTYSQYARSSTLPPKPTEEELRTESEIKELLSQVTPTHP
jgi:hypothetical protein